MAQRGYKRSWKNLLLDTEYQLVFTLALVLSAALFMAGLGYVVMKEADTATKTAIQDVQGQGILDAQVADDTIQGLASRRSLLNIILITVGVGLSAGLFVYGIKMTHKVAGPLHKVSLYCDKVVGGKWTPVYNLRKGDQLVEFYAHFKQAYDAVKRGEENDVVMLRDVIAAADLAELAGRSPELAATLDDLKALLAEKEASLG